MFWVRRGVIGGSHMPYSLDEIDDWKAEGIRRVLVLAEDWEIEEAWGNSDYYFSLLKERGFEVLHSPVPDGHPPEEGQFREIVNWLDKGKGNLIHCVGGIGRTGTVIAGYLMVKEGLSAQDAVEEVRKYRPGAVQTLNQFKFLLKLEGIWSSATP
jgi:protein-tyrosine phosphatase